MTHSSTPQRSVPTRRISFEESLQELPKHFAADGDLILSHLAAALSAETVSKATRRDDGSRVSCTTTCSSS